MYFKLFKQLGELSGNQWIPTIVPLTMKTDATECIGERWGVRTRILFGFGLIARVDYCRTTTRFTTGHHQEGEGLWVQVKHGLTTHVDN